MTSTRPKQCPYCGSTKLTFAEQLASVTVYQCSDCGRAVSVSRPHTDQTAAFRGEETTHGQ